MEKIQINNDITIATLNKIYYTQKWYQTWLDDASDMNQFQENIDNEYITKRALEIIINEIFKDKNGGFRDTLKCFGNRAKKRFIKAKLIELLENGERINVR